jgi:hypothetical protein
MGYASTSSNDKILTTLFPNRMAETGYDQCRFYALAKKDTDFRGSGKVTVVNFAPTSGGGATFANAQANQNPTQQAKFTIAHKLEYQVFSIQGALLRRAQGKGAIVNALKNEMEGALYQFWRAIAAGTWGNGGGSRGVIHADSTVSSTSITLATPADISRFEVGMYIQLATDDGSGSSPAGTLDSGAQARITGITEDTATLRFAVALSTSIPSAATGNYIFRSGDYSVRFSGVPGWNPITTPTSGDSFKGQDRSNAPERLSGHRVTSTGGTKEETLIQAGAVAKQFGIKVTHCFAHPLDIAGLFKSLSSQVVVQKTDMPSVSFEGVNIITPGGRVTLVGETDTPKGYFWMNNPSNYTYRSAGPLGQVLDNDGLRMMRQSNDDAYEQRLGADLDIDCDNPGHCIIGTW